MTVTKTFLLLSLLLASAAYGRRGRLGQVITGVRRETNKRARAPSGPNEAVIPKEDIQVLSPLTFNKGVHVMPLDFPNGHFDGKYDDLGDHAVPQVLPPQPQVLLPYIPAVGPEFLPPRIDDGRGEVQVLPSRFVEQDVGGRMPMDFGNFDLVSPQRPNPSPYTFPLPLPDFPVYPTAPLGGVQAYPLVWLERPGDRKGVGSRAFSEADAFGVNEKEGFQDSDARMGYDVPMRNRRPGIANAVWYKALEDSE